MPLHDWSRLEGWQGVHHFWMGEITRDLNANLPAGYKAVIGSHPLVKSPDIGGKPDVAVARRTVARTQPRGTETSEYPEPDYAVAVADIEEELTVMVTQGPRVVALVELISPRNKDRPSEREQCGKQYEFYLRSAVNVMLVDVHRLPLGFSFAQYLGAALRLAVPEMPAPMVASYGIGGALPDGGSMFDIWQRPLVVGQPLPKLPLALRGVDYVNVNLEATYARAAADGLIEDV
jgi:hypothetical protein